MRLYQCCDVWVDLDHILAVSDGVYDSDIHVVFAFRDKPLTLWVRHDPQYCDVKNAWTEKGDSWEDAERKTREQVKQKLLAAWGRSS